MSTANTYISPVDIETRKSVDIRSGDTVRVSQKIREGEKTRLQVFEGLVIARKHGTEPGATFTVRRVASGVGVEKVFPLYSPMIDKVEVTKRGKVRRSKLYYIREKASKEIRKKIKQLKFEASSVIQDKIKEKEESEQKEADAKSEAIKEAKAEASQKKTENAEEPKSDDVYEQKKEEQKIEKEEETLIEKAT
jgi:large subunit ribosomal protein L19